MGAEGKDGRSGNMAMGGAWIALAGVEISAGSACETDIGQGLRSARTGPYCRVFSPHANEWAAYQENLEIPDIPEFPERGREEDC